MLNEFVKMKINVNSLKLIYFHGNETDICIIKSIYSGNVQQKVY